MATAIVKQSSAMELDKENAAPMQGLSDAQIRDMYVNCLKLASEGKITSKNTWQLKLIDHLDDLVKPIETDGGLVNFQRASCTIDAGVKIYSCRVDSVLNDAVKMLGGGLQDDQEGAEDGADTQPDTVAKPARRKAVDVNPASTLRDAADLTLAEIDDSQHTDPLFHRMSAQFDAGGPAGLLLHNLLLSTTAPCAVRLDADAPFVDLQAPANQHQQEGAQRVQCQALRDTLHSMQGSALGVRRISPAMDALLELLGTSADKDWTQRTAAMSGMLHGMATTHTLLMRCQQCKGTGDACAAGDHSDAAADHAHDAVYYGSPGPAATFDDTSPVFDFGPAHSLEDTTGLPDDGDDDEDPNLWGAQSRDQISTGTDQSQAPPGGWLLRDLVVGTAPGQHWAGASHWRFGQQKTAAAADGSRQRSMHGAKSKSAVATLCFTALPPFDPDALTLAPEATITLKTAATAATLLPEDSHYDVGQLTHCFLQPHVQLGGRGQAGAATGDSDDEEQGGWGAGDWGGGDGPWAGAGGMEADHGALQLVDMPTMPEAVQVPYARRAKQVDVRALKETLWQQAQAAPTPGPQRFSQLLATIPEANPAGPLPDLSVHLCFICLLHLANEHGLAIQTSDGLDELTVCNV